VNLGVKIAAVLALQDPVILIREYQQAARDLLALQDRPVFE
jgi:hypothetical protein